MNNIRVWIHSRQLALVISTGLLSSLPVLSQPVQTTPNPNIKLGGTAETSIFAVPPPPTDYGEPGKRSSAGSRNCAAPKTQARKLTALVPTSEVAGKNIVGGLTTALNPTFWFYVPFQLRSKDSIEFVLKDKEKNYVYQTKLPGKGNPYGIVDISLPPSITLEANQSYRWHFLIYCNSSVPSDFVSGLIRRIERPELDQQLATATPRERIELYADAGIWYDAFTNLARLYRKDQKNLSLKQDWERLMQDIQLEPLASEPFSTCCAPIP